MGYDHEHDFDRGLAFDLSTLLLQRRRVLGLIGAIGLTTLTACTDGTSVSAPTGSPAAPTGSPAGNPANCEKIPAETAGPFPGDGSNGPNILTQSGIVRSDIRSSFGGASGVAQGVPLTINLTIQNSGSSCAALAGAAVYVWQCDREGGYSMYSPSVAQQNYLRGVQAADASGRVSFISVFPGAYSGRWPHVHFEVYPDLAAATSANRKVATSQLAFPKDACDAVYATAGYSGSVAAMQRLSLETDGVFRDGAERQMATMTGSASSGYVANLVVPV